MTEPLTGQIVLPEYEEVLGYSVYSDRPKILGFADVHLGNYRYPIREHIISALNEITNLVRANRPDLVVFAGDAFRTKVPSAADVSVFGDAIWEMARISRVLMVPGNHDTTGQGHTTIDVYDNYKNVMVVKEPKVIELDGYEVVAVPWLPQRAMSSFGFESEDVTGTTEMLLQLLKSRLTPGKFHLLVAHCTTFGARYGDVNVIIGRDVLWKPDWFSGFDLSILGHLHRPQQVDYSAFYTGSICPVSFNESGQNKYVLYYAGGVDEEYHARVEHFKLSSPLFVQAYPEELEAEPGGNIFLQIKKPHDQEDPKIPPCLWYEIIPQQPPKNKRPRLDSDEAVLLTPMEAIETYLQLKEEDPEPVLRLAAELMEEDDD